jgi:hypothetical protein
VLIAGGFTGFGYLVSAELYDQSTGGFTPTGSMHPGSYTGRCAHTATLLPNGTVLVAGGYADDTTIANAELYDPNAGVFAATGSLTAARRSHTATLLPSGMMLVAGGYASGAILASAESYDPGIGRFVADGSMTETRWLHTATLLPSGTVLIAGGWDLGGAAASAELHTQP